MSDQAKQENALPFGGKFAAFLLLLVAAAAVVLAALSVKCAFVSEIPLLGCSWKESTGDGIKNAKAAVFAVGCVVFIWLAVSVAVFVWRWADGLLFGGKWAIVSLAAIIVGESVITEFWQGYVNSFGKVTDKLVWVLLLWFVVAWRGKSVMDWVTRSLQKAAEAPVNKVKETVKDAAQTMKTTADGITKDLHDAAEAVKNTAESATESFKDISMRAVSTVGEGANTVVKGVSNTAGAVKDTVVSAGETIAEMPGRAVSAVTGSRSEDDKQATPEKDEGATEKPAKENEGEKGILDKVVDVFSPDKKDKGGD